MKKVLLLPLTALLIGCSTSKKLNHPTTFATLWVQNAAEFDALTTLVYRTAADHIELANQDSFWTAFPSQEQKKSSFYELPPAIIMDVDETVLDNSPFQARLIKKESSYNPDDWNQWVREAKADAIPGALEFAKYAAQKEITIFYVTNREHKVEEATRKNLQQLGFPLSDSLDVILTKNEKKSWTSDKTNRRAFIAQHYRVLMLVGDDLNDFVHAKNKSAEERMELVDSNKTMWGNKWYILPNPIYGSWQQALYNFDNSLNEKGKDQIIKKQLKPKQN